MKKKKQKEKKVKGTLLLTKLKSASPRRVRRTWMTKWGTGSWK